MSLLLKSIEVGTGDESDATERPYQLEFPCIFSPFGGHRAGAPLLCSLKTVIRGYGSSQEEISAKDDIKLLGTRSVA